MKNRGEIIICSLIMAVALIICTNMLKRTRFFEGQLNASTNFGGSITAYDGQNIGKSYDEVLSIYDAASYLRMEQSSLEAAINNGNKLSIPYVSAGGQIIFSKKALDEWVYNTSKSGLKKP